MAEKVYLGDSVYARFDGYGVMLTTENGKPDDPSNEIYLGPDELKSLNSFVVASMRGIETNER